MNKILAILKAMGIAEAEAQKLIEASKDDAIQFDINPLVAMAAAHQRKLFENDPEIIDKFKGEERGKQLDIITRELKKTFGLSSDEIKDKAIKDVIEFAKTKATTTTDKSVETLQNELIAANNKLKDYEENVIPSKLAEVEGHKKKITIENELTKLISSKKLRVPFEAAFPTLTGHLSNQYDLDIDDKKQLHIYLKGTKVQPTKEDKTGLLGINDIMDSKLKEWKFIEESNAGAGTGTGTGQQRQQVIVDDPNGGTGKKVHFPGAEKAKAALEEAKTAPKD